MQKLLILGAGGYGRTVAEAKPGGGRAASAATQVVAVVRYLAKTAEEEGKAAKPLWLPPLPNLLPLKELEASYGWAMPQEELCPLAGEFDDPANQRKGLLTLPFPQCGNVLVLGMTGSGKTTLLNVLSSFIPENERIVTIEDAAELQLGQEHVITLESRPSNLEGRGQITIRDLVKNALRMRPDRIIVGEVRSGEALDMLQAMNTGHDGSLTTTHANSPRDALSRIETMVLMSGMELPLRAIREQIASAIDIVVQQSRMRDGTRKVLSISEVCGMEGDMIVLQEIFHYKTSGQVDSNGKFIGSFSSTGIHPLCMEKIRNNGVTVYDDWFQ